MSERISQSDQLFLLEHFDISEDQLAEMLENLKKTLDQHKVNSQVVTKGFQDSMLVKRK